MCRVRHTLRREPIRHLLTMSSGVRFTEICSGADDVWTLSRLSLLGESEGGDPGFGELLALWGAVVEGVAKMAY